MAWKQKVSKQIKLVYLVYSDGYYHLFEFRPTGDDYNGLRLVKEKRYSIRNDKITRNDLEMLLYAPIIQEPEVPFPQANEVSRLLSLIDFYGNQDGSTTKDAITEQQDFTDRQTDYYLNALRYLGFVEMDDSLTLSDLGNAMVDMSLKERDLTLAKQILCHSVFRKVFTNLRYHLYENDIIQKVVPLMKESNLYGIDSEATYRRRASTIVAWIRWIANLPNQD